MHRHLLSCLARENPSRGVSLYLIICVFRGLRSCHRLGDIAILHSFERLQTRILNFEILSLGDKRFELGLLVVELVTKEARFSDLCQVYQSQHCNHKSNNDCVCDRTKLGSCCVGDGVLIATPLAFGLNGSRRITPSGGFKCVCHSCGGCLFWWVTLASRTGQRSPVQS